MSGDDARAKQTVRGLLNDLGWAPETIVDLGDIGTARASEHYFVMFAALLRAKGTPLFNIRVVN